MFASRTTQFEHAAELCAKKIRTIRWGIIGLGDIAERNFVPALVKAADGQLVSVFSRSVDKGNAFIAN